MKIVDKSLDFWVGRNNKIKGPEGGPHKLSSATYGNTIDRMGDFFLGVPEIMNPNTNWSKAVYKQRGGLYTVFGIISHKGTMYFLSIRYIEDNGFNLDNDVIKKIADHAVDKFNNFLESL